MSTRSHFLRVAVLATVFTALGAWAQPVPEKMSFTANLTNSGLPETGTHDFVFTLYDAATAGTNAWTETQSALPVDNGLVFTTLGTTTPLTASILNGAELWLEVSVDGTVLSPRAAIVSVPYAIRAGVADSASSVGGLMGSELQKRVSGACVGANAIQNIDPDGGVTCVAVSGAGSTGDITDVTTAAGSGLVGGVPSGNANISLMPCTTGQVLKSNGTTWACAADTDTDTDTTYTAGLGLSLGGTTFSLNSTGCSTGFVLKWTGSGWACQADTDTDTNTTYSAGAGLTLGGTVFSIGNSAISNAMLVNSAVTVSPGAGLTGGGSVGLGSAITLALANCPANQIYKMNAGGTAWTCVPESSTAYSAGAGLALVGTTFSLSTAGCVSGDIWKWNGSAWTCVPDTDTNTTYSAGAGLTLGGTTFSIGSNAISNAMLANSSVTISAAAPLQIGGSVALGGTTSLLLQTCGAGQVLKMNAGGTAWTCAVDADTNTTYTASRGVTLVGSDFQLATCGANQIYKMNAGGTSWTCGTDIDTDTTYGATAPIALSAGSFRLNNCPAGQIYKMNAGGTAWTCAVDDDSVYTNAMAVAAVTAQTVVHFATFGPTDFKMAALDGTSLNCLMPSSNCALPTNTTTDLYVNSHIPAPATVTDVDCLVLDNDTVGNITLTFFNGSGTTASASTTGATSGSQTVSVTGLSAVVTSSSRGPVFRLTFASGSGQPTMYAFSCDVRYTTNGL